MLGIPVNKELKLFKIKNKRIGINIVKMIKLVLNMKIKKC